jgi:hypothetical protein
MNSTARVSPRRDQQLNRALAQAIGPHNAKGPLKFHAREKNPFEQNNLLLIAAPWDRVEAG